MSTFTPAPEALNLLTSASTAGLSELVKLFQNVIVVTGPPLPAAEVAAADVAAAEVAAAAELELLAAWDVAAADAAVDVPADAGPPAAAEVDAGAAVEPLELLHPARAKLETATSATQSQRRLFMLRTFR